MEEVFSIYVVSGVTSSLFASLLPFLIGKYDIYATIRAETCMSRINVLGEQGIKFISYTEALNKKFARVLWLSTHDDAELLSKFSTTTPTLAINSGAILDILLGKQDLSTANGYQKSKLALYNVPNVYSFIPGFFIENLPVPAWASRGLHGDTTAKLFSPQFDPSFDWGKAYSVTPKSYIVETIQMWLYRPERFERATLLCTDRQYRRHELRRFVPNLPITADGKGVDAPILYDPIYSSFPHPPILLTEADVERACQKAAAHFQ